jgi:flagellar protein FlaI
MMASVHLAIVQYRQRRKGYRRTLQAAEIVDLSGRENVELDTNLLYQWQSKTDTWDKVRESKRLFSHIKFFSGLDDEELQQDLQEKQRILKYMLKNDIRDIESVSKTIHTYYNNRSKLREHVEKGKVLE